MTLPRLALLLAALAGPLLAQNAETQPTVIESQKLDMKSTDAETTSIFEGNVIVTGTNLKLTCDRLEVVAFRAKGDPGATIGKVERFKSLVATGSVHIVQGDREAACGKAVVLPGDDKITLSDRPVVTDRGVGWTWTGDELLLLRGERQVRGTNVRIVGPPVKDLGFDKDKKVEGAPETPKQP
ncbi:LptA/OstA family protein [Oleiharenicola sp. Vm1]|uniref:LptA/OstA family protein n=1 Tax=Oleiharenicola sp. Vm1 TaxID=3398393 RepID=UPI0039F52606